MPAADSTSLDVPGELFPAFDARQQLPTAYDLPLDLSGCDCPDATFQGDRPGGCKHRKALRLPAKATAEATVRVVGRFANERAAGEEFGQWLERVGGAGTLGLELKELDEFPDPEERPDFYVDFDETGPYEAIVGAGECAGA